jgi:anti-anti-sigma regulatory factor
MVLRLADEVGTVLTGRFDAARARERLEQAAAAGEAVIDLRGVEAISPSFADEFFAKLPTGLLESHAVRFEHMTPEIEAIVRAVTAARAQRENS